MKKFLQVLTIVLLVCLLFRGPIFRAIVGYTGTGEVAIHSTERDGHQLNIKLAFRSLAPLEQGDLSVLNRLALDYTIRLLTFRAEQNFQTIDDIRGEAQGHCVGYASVYASVMQLLLLEAGIEDIEVVHRRGEISLLGLQLTGCCDHPFFEDHDFIELRSAEDGIGMIVDPSVYEFTRIAVVQ